MWIGHFQLGDLLPLRVRTLSSAGTPTEPDDAPAVHVYDSDGASVYTQQLPIRDRSRITGYFHDKINLDSRFSTGRFSVLYTWAISSTVGSCVAEFEIQAGGNVQGNGISMEFFRQSAADFVLLQTDTGHIKRLKNPAVRNVST